MAASSLAWAALPEPMPANFELETLSVNAGEWVFSGQENMFE